MDPPPVEDVRLEEARAAAPLVEAWTDSGGFTAPRISRAAETLADMLDREGTFVLSFPAAVVATGLRGVLRDLVARGHVDAVVTTCGTLDHDVARSEATYRQGRFEMDDEQLKAEGYHRLGSVLVPEAAYGPLIEETLADVLDEVEAAGSVTGVQLCRRIGELLSGHERSLLATCAGEDVPVFVPGLVDGAVGSQLWARYEMDRDLSLDLLADQHEISNVLGDADTLDAFMVGGGISKHHTIWWAQFADGLDRAVYVTTAVEHDGSLSGARMREAISWDKLKATADRVTVPGEATALVPPIVGAAVERLDA